MDASDAEVLRSAELANALGFIEQGGENLDGDEKIQAHLEDFQKKKRELRRLGYENIGVIEAEDLSTDE